MPARTKKRRSEGQVYKATPSLKQVDFPAPRRSIKEQAPSWSAPSKYQQTITQMNPFFEIYHPDAENRNLEYSDEEDEDTILAAPVARKRRKITLQEPPARKIETRSSRRQVFKQEHPQQEVDESEGEQLKLPSNRTQMKPSMPQSSAVLMPPPKTPRSVMKKEIPSSQSPVDTPLSYKSRDSTRDTSRSPLKERSTNLVPPFSQKRGSHWTKKLEVADSMETVEDESPVLSRVSSMISLTSRTPRAEDTKDAAEALPQISEIPTPNIDNLREIPESSQRRDLDERRSSQAQMDREILDSDEELDDEYVESEAGLEVQPPLLNLNASIPNSNQRSAFGLFPSELVEFEPEGIETQVSSPSGSAADFFLKGGTEANNASGMEASYFTTPRRSQQQHSDSDGASAQLRDDLRRATQAGGLETESQFEGAWNPYHPGNIIDLASDPSDLRSSPEHVGQTPSEPTAVPTQLLTPRPTTSSSPLKIPVPPSQATTVDITQSSPPKMPSSSHRLPSQRKMRSSSQVYPSSPPPMAPPTSSPTDTRKAADPLAGFEWNGVRLTDSQLLPESLMHDSLLEPPLVLTQESLDDDEL
ncbi:hypothetical protein P7C71_g1100, partial [Lecanoromycetidae sp. Uapishka_2]